MALECGGQTWTQREEPTIEAGCLLLGDSNKPQEAEIKIVST